MKIQILVSGDPKGQPRPRAFAFNGKARIYNVATAEGWKGLVAQAARAFIPQTPMDGPVSVSSVFVMPRPKAHFRTGKRAHELKDGAPLFHSAKPDRDNLDKAVLDALTTLGMFGDDCQVCDGRISKVYAEPGKPCGARITIETLSHNQALTLL